MSSPSAFCHAPFFYQSTPVPLYVLVKVAESITMQCGPFHQKIKVWPSCQLCQHFFTSIIPVGSNVTPLIKGEWLLILPHKAFHPRVLESAVTPPNYSTTDLRFFSIFTMQDPFGSQVCANIQYRKSAIQCPEQWWEVMISRSLKMLRFFWSARTP